MATQETFERIVVFDPAYDRRNPDPSKNYGIHGVTIRFILKGTKGATHFVLFTNWHLPHVQAELDARCDPDIARALPLPADLGYHSPRPMYEGHRPIEKCPYVEGGTCYYDGSALAAQSVYERLLREGDAGVWAELESLYRDRFGSADQRGR